MHAPPRRPSRSRLGIAVVALAIAACGSGGGGRAAAKAKWLAAGWTPVEAEIDGVRLTVDVPQGFPDNDRQGLGRSWLTKAPGPRLFLYVKERKFAGADGFAEQIESPSRPDLQMVESPAADGNGYRYVFTTADRPRHEVARWIPTDETHGVQCEATWYDPQPDQAPRRTPPDRELIAWLDRFCASVKLH